MTNTNDLRYVRTETSIRNTFIELAAERPKGSITVTELCRHAGISRNAFYLHYASVPALCMALVGEIVSEIRYASIASAECRTSTGHDDELISDIVGVLAKHEELMRALMPSDDGSLAKCLAEGIEEAFVAAALRFGEHGGSFEHRLRCSYTSWGVVGLALCWVTGTQRSISEALPRYEELLASGYKTSAEYLENGITPTCQA